MKHNIKNANKGFTLIELSIVLVIIGLIVAGIVSGRSLIRSAELKSIINDINVYQTALNNFMVQYDAIPGDMVNASEYWPSCASPATLCNGNGNSKIEDGTDEPLRAFQALSLASIIKGTYTGVAVGGGQKSGVNIPASEIKGSGYLIHSLTNSDYFFTRITDNFITLGTFTSFANNYESGVLTPPEAKSLDKKIDDGAANTGKFIAANGAESSPGDCVSVVSPNYDVSKTELDCIIAVQIN